MVINTSQRRQSTSTLVIFITGRTKQVKLEVKFCPAEDTIADYFTKPLQGEPFIKSHNSNMNLKN